MRQIAGVPIWASAAILALPAVGNLMVLFGYSLSNVWWAFGLCVAAAVTSLVYAFFSTRPILFVLGIFWALAGLVFPFFCLVIAKAGVAH